jgi:hypothetical protein
MIDRPGRLWHNSYAVHAERSHSGRLRRFAKPMKGQLFRGFESHPLRLYMSPKSHNLPPN